MEQLQKQAVVNAGPPKPTKSKKAIEEERSRELASLFSQAIKQPKARALCVCVGANAAGSRPRRHRIRAAAGRASLPLPLASSSALPIPPTQVTTTIHLTHPLTLQTLPKRPRNTPKTHPKHHP